MKSLSLSEEVNSLQRIDMELPAAFIEQIRNLLNEEEANCFFNALQEEQPVSIRLNPYKHGYAELKERTIGRFNAQEVSWCSDAYYLDKRPTFTFDPLFHAGCYYVQEAGSMFLEQVFKQIIPQHALTALDLCAAPGGKSTHIRALLPEGSLLVANEVIRNRSQILAENLTKWGHPDVIVTNNDPADFTPMEEMFDFILTDVPCSGEGMFRKDTTAINEWSEENVNICQLRQQRILSDIWPCLKPGGLLVYSTCTYNTKENEENIRWICEKFEAEVLPIEVPTNWGITGNLLKGETFPVYRFMPHKTQSEGLFLAVLRKPATSESSNTIRYEFKEKDKSRKGKQKAEKGYIIGKEQLHVIQQWLKSDTYKLYTEGNVVNAFHTSHVEVLQQLRSSLRILQAGIAVAELKGKDWVPCHSFALSQLAEKNIFPHAEINLEQAIAYLRKETIQLSNEVPRGFVLLTYNNRALGFVKNIGNRANNLYPQEWRIRSGHLPEEFCIL